MSLLYADREDRADCPPLSPRAWTRSKQPSHLNLELHPMYLHFGDEEIAAPRATISFHLDTVSVLLGRSGSGGDERGRLGLQLDHEVAAVSRAAVTSAARQLASRIRLECCAPPRNWTDEQEDQDSGLSKARFRWVVVGAFSEPPHVSYSWPMSSNCPYDDLGVGET